jgi:uracil-DNA glycosylase
MGSEPTRRWVLQSMGVTVWERRGADPSAPPEPVRDPPPRPPIEHRVDIAPPQQPDPLVEAPQGEIADMGWDALEAAVASCTRCPLHHTRTQGVFGVGAREANWLIVGEAPGAEEDDLGEPFVGRSGQLLDRMLEAVGLDRQTVFIANILKSRPPENRNPTPEEAAACKPYLDRQIELVRPGLILAVGKIAAQNLLASTDAVGRLRGKVHTYGHDAIPLVVTYHPAYLLRQPSAKGKVWQDLKLARRTAAAALK